MSWYPSFVFYLGVFDAAVIMAGGLAVAFVTLVGWDASKLWGRVVPATFALILSNAAAALILAAVRYLIS